MQHGCVQLHLEHRVVRRLLQRFVAHGFTQDGLNRASALLSNAFTLPRVLLIGRLSLFGEGATRLHDQLVFVEAEFDDATSALTPLSSELSNDKLISPPVPEHLKEAMAKSSEVASHTLNALRARVNADVTLLRPLAEERASVAARLASDKLTARGLEEAKLLEQQLKTLKAQLGDVKTHLEAHISGVESELHEAEDMIRKLNKDRSPEMDQEELRARQLKVDLQAVNERLKVLNQTGYVKAEMTRAKAAFEARLKRVEPVGMIYLWPTSKA